VIFSRKIEQQNQYKNGSKNILKTNGINFFSIESKNFPETFSIKKKRKRT
jgi:hypothetical protein